MWQLTQSGLCQGEQSGSGGCGPILLSFSTYGYDGCTSYLSHTLCRHTLPCFTSYFGPVPALAALGCASCLDWQIPFHIALLLSLMRSCSHNHFHLWFIICPCAILLKSWGFCLSLCIRALQILLSETPKAFLKCFRDTRKQWVNISKTSQKLRCYFPPVRRKEKGEVFAQWHSRNGQAGCHLSFAGTAL